VRTSPGYYCWSGGAIGVPSSFTATRRRRTVGVLESVLSDELLTVSLVDVEADELLPLLPDDRRVMWGLSSSSVADDAPDPDDPPEIDVRR
jgi:hypothetical protein